MAVVTITAAGPWEGGKRTAERAAAASADRARDTGAAGAEAAPEPAAAVLTALGPRRDAAQAGTSDLPLPSRQGLEAALAPLLDSPELGTSQTLAVMDATTGKLLYGVGEDRPATPASTIKLATAVAALDVLGAEHRIPTTVAQGGAEDEIVLVGGGDPTLTALRTRRGPGDGAASLRRLARSTARALKDRGVRRVRLAYDTSAYSGPRLHPIGVNDNIAPVTALMADEGRRDPGTTGHAPRREDPAASAAASFAGFLKNNGITVRGTPAPGRADKAVEGRLAEVRSAPLGELVEQMLTHSDNDIAEALARQTAMAMGLPASFDGAAEAVADALKAAGLDTGDSRFHDGSGLDGEDALSAGLLARVLALTASPDHPELRPVLSGLPVAGFTGTLAGRFTAGRGSGRDGPRNGSGNGQTGDAHRAAGLVRAKTGTLTGVNTLAGAVVDADGRLLTFAFMTKGATDASALDRLAAAVAGCGCR